LQLTTDNGRQFIGKVVVEWGVNPTACCYS
jgi:hypothetical protein